FASLARQPGWGQERSDPPAPGVRPPRCAGPPRPRSGCGAPGGGSGRSRQTGDGPDRAQWAARLFGAAAALRELMSAPVHPRRPAEHDRQITAARAMLDAATFDAAWADGRGMTPDQAIASALRGAGESEERAPGERSDAGGG